MAIYWILSAKRDRGPLLYCAALTSALSVTIVGLIIDCGGRSQLVASPHLSIKPDLTLGTFVIERVTDIIEPENRNLNPLGQFNPH